MATHSPFTKPTVRASRTNSAPAAVTPSRCMRRNSAIVLWYGASRPSNHINSMFRRHSDSSRREERIFFFQAEDGIRDLIVTGVQTCALQIYSNSAGGTSPIELWSRRWLYHQQSSS